MELSGYFRHWKKRFEKKNAATVDTIIIHTIVFVLVSLSLMDRRNTFVQNSDLCLKIRNILKQLRVVQKERF